MLRALQLAAEAAAMGEVPVGAVIVEKKSGRIIAEAHNLVENHKDPTAHAEVLALRQAAALMATPRLVSCDLYVTLEPCPMCARHFRTHPPPHSRLMIRRAGASSMEQ